ncbi:MAG: capsule biosynthesis protein [Ruegeria sp.]
MTLNEAPSERVFLFLQGPHGPFFDALAKMLRTAGATVLRVGFNAGDRAFWFHKDSYIPYQGTLAEWPDTLDTLLAEHGVTDIVLYGDTRPIHARATEAARARGLALHVFEEGYLRPWWVTYERGGSNGHSRLMEMPVAHMQAALVQSDAEAPPPPSHWGDMRQHVFYGALYHWFVMFWNRRYRNFQPHRDLPVSREFHLYLKRLLMMPLHWLQRRQATRNIRNGGFPYHLVLLQLEHDSSFQNHSPFASMTEFLDRVFEGFAHGAPRHHHLVIKAHPLENYRVPLRREIRQLAKRYGLTDRIHYVPGGKLAQLLDDARSAVTVNSTAGQQALWRGIPLRVFGAAVYAKPEFVSTQPISAFFAAPDRPDSRAYRDYRHYLLETSQIPGGFYSRRGRRQLLRRVVDMVLSHEDPYQALTSGKAAARQHLQVVT